VQYTASIVGEVGNSWVGGVGERERERERERGGGRGEKHQSKAPTEGLLILASESCNLYWLMVSCRAFGKTSRNRIVGKVNTHG